MKCKGMNIPTKINLGCGNDYKPGYINVDNNEEYISDIYHDLNVFPYPFESNNFSEVLMSMILEHFDNPIKVLKEIIRISQDRAKVIIIVPHADSYANKTDIQHKTDFTEHSFNEELMKEYGLQELKQIGFEFVYKHKWKRFVPIKKLFNNIFEDLKFEFEVRK